jgi:REP-associated tyrosine transposase
MPRPLRDNAPGGIVHVTSRGVNGCPIYRTTSDRRGFVALLGEVSERFRWLVYAFCLMGNHYHLVLQTTWPTLSAGVQRLNGIHAQRFNRRHGRYGHLFQGRFKSEPVERDAHLLLACRYVVLNPVAAGLCRRPEDWPWSSYRVTAGLTENRLLALDGLLPLFGRDEAGAQLRYREFVGEGASRAVTA